MHLRLIKSITLLAGVLAVSACGHEMANSPKPEVTMTVLNTRDAEFVRLMNQCPTKTVGGQKAAFIPPVVALVAPVVIDYAVSAFGDYLQRLESERSGAFIAFGAGKLSEVEKTDAGKSPTSCLVIARGIVGGDAPATLDDWAKVAGLTAQPDFYFETQIERSTQPVPATEKGKADGVQTQLTLKPQFLYYARTSAKRGRDDDKSLSLVLVMRSTTAPENPTSTTAAKDAEAVFPLALGRYKPGISLTRDQNKNLFLGLDRVASISGAVDPLNFYAFVSEEADQNKALSLLSATFTKKSESIQEGLTKAITDALNAKK